MISDKLLTEYSYIVSARFEAINTRYIKLMARQIKEIGKLTPSNIKRLEQMSKMSTNIAEINDLLAKESNITLNELYKVYDMSAMSIYQDAEKLYKSNGKTQIPFEQNTRIQSHLESMKMLTKGSFSNLSNTTAIHEGYRQLVDMAIDAIESGTDNYQSVIDNILTNPDLSSLGRSVDGGLRVQYASGYTRRLDSAVRMNVLGGLRQVNNGINEIAGKEFGADGVEITAHALCAEDHLPVQGRQFAKGPAREINGIFYPSFEQMNSQLRRKISTWNCKHSTRVILLGISGPSYTEEELEQYKNLSTQKVKIGDKEVTRYQASQMMRNLETEIRYAKDKIIFAEEAGFPDIQSKAEQRLTDLRKRYNYVSNQANLQQQLDRTYVPGYTGIGNPKPNDIVLKPTSKNSTTIRNELNFGDSSQFAKETIIGSMSKFKNEFGVNDLITSISYTEKDFEGLMEGSYAYIHPDSPNILHLNPKVYQSEDIFDSYVGNRIKAYHNNATPESILIHEQAHILGTMLDENSILSKSINQYFEKFPNIKNSDPMYAFMPDFQIVGEQISRYASTTEHELWAETIADFIVNKNNSSEFSKILVNNIKEVLK